MSDQCINLPAPFNNGIAAQIYPPIIFCPYDSNYYVGTSAGHLYRSPSIEGIFTQVLKRSYRILLCGYYDGKIFFTERHDGFGYYDIDANIFVNKKSSSSSAYYAHYNCYLKDNILLRAGETTLDAWDLETITRLYEWKPYSSSVSNNGSQLHSMATHDKKGLLPSMRDGLYKNDDITKNTWTNLNSGDYSTVYSEYVDDTNEFVFMSKVSANGFTKFVFNSYEGFVNNNFDTERTVVSNLPYSFNVNAQSYHLAGHVNGRRVLGISNASQYIQDKADDWSKWTCLTTPYLRFSGTSMPSQSIRELSGVFTSDKSFLGLELKPDVVLQDADLLLATNTSDGITYKVTGAQFKEFFK